RRAVTAGVGEDLRAVRVLSAARTLGRAARGEERHGGEAGAQARDSASLDLSSHDWLPLSWLGLRRTPSPEGSEVVRRLPGRRRAASAKAVRRSRRKSGSTTGPRTMAEV